MFRKKTSKKLSSLLVVLMAVMLLVPAINTNAAGAAGSPANNAVQFLHNDYTNNGLNVSVKRAVTLSISGGSR